MKSFFLCIAVVVLYICRVLAGQTYSKSLDITGAAFYDEFRFDNSADPTHGRVYASPCPISSSVLTVDLCFSFLSEYVDQQTAQQYNLTYVAGDSFVVRADYTTYLSPSDPGRKSVRIVSYKQFSTFVAMFVCSAFHETLRIHISLASTYVTCQKDAGEPLNHTCPRFMSARLHLEHGQPYGL